MANIKIVWKMMLDNLRSDYNNKPKLCAIPNGYPLSPHSGAPSSIDFPTTLSLTITRQDHAYHLKSSNFSASLVGIPFFPGFEDDPFLHGPRTRSSSDDGEMIDMTDEEIAAIINEAIQENKTEKKTSRQKKKDKTPPTLDQSEATKEQDNEKPSTLKDSRKKEKEVEIKKEKEVEVKKEKEVEVKKRKEVEVKKEKEVEIKQAKEVEVKKEMGEDKMKEYIGKKVKEQKKAPSDDSYSKAAILYPKLYDGTISDEREDSFDDYQEVVAKKKRRNKKVSNSSSIIIPNDRQSKKLSENSPNHRSSKKSTELLSQQKAGQTSDKQVVIDKSPSSVKPTQQQQQQQQQPPDPVKPSQPTSRSTAVPTLGFQKSAWSKPLVHPPAPSTQTKSKSVPSQSSTHATPVQLIPNDNGSSNSSNAQFSGNSSKQSPGPTGPQQSQMSETSNFKGRNPGSLGFEALDIYPSKKRQLSQVQPAPRQKSTTSKPVHKIPENRVPVEIKSSKSSGLAQQSLSSKPVNQAPSLPKTSTQQTHVRSSKSSGTETQPQSLTPKAVQQAPSPSKMPQHQKPVVSETSKAQGSVQAQPSSNVHQTSNSSQIPSQIKTPVSRAPKPSSHVKQKPTSHQASSSPSNTSVEPYSLPRECVPHGRIGDHKLGMMSAPQDLPIGDSRFLPPSPLPTSNFLNGRTLVAIFYNFRSSSRNKPAELVILRTFRVDL
nr:hypothetical transcript [Hymenolepis microstoma]